MTEQSLCQTYGTSEASDGLVDKVSPGGRTPPRRAGKYSLPGAEYFPQGALAALVNEEPGEERARPLHDGKQPRILSQTPCAPCSLPSRTSQMETMGNIRVNSA